MCPAGKQENRSPSGTLGNNDASPARPMQGAYSSIRADLASDALALRVATQAWHRSFARVASGRAAPVSCKSMRHSLPHSLPLRSLFPRSLRSLRSSGSLRFSSFRRSFSRTDSQSTRCLLFVRHLPVAGRYHIGFGLRLPTAFASLRRAGRLRPDN
jgi:hypothetical protein